MKFVAGITKLKNFGEEVLKQAIKEASKREKHREGQTSPNNYCLELLYKCQTVEFLKEECFYYCNEYISADELQHYFALGHCIANSKSNWELTLHAEYGTDFDDVYAVCESDTEKALDMFLQGLVSCKVQPDCTRSVILDIHDNFVFFHITSAPEHVLAHITGLQLFMMRIIMNLGNIGMKMNTIVNVSFSSIVGFLYLPIENTLTPLPTI